MVSGGIIILPVWDAIPCWNIPCPLVSLLSSKKNIALLSPRIQRFRMRLMRYAYTISHVPGNNLVATDALSSSSPVRPLTADESQFAEEVSEQANLVMVQIPATETHLAEIRACQREDDVCRQVMIYCLEGWPTFPSLPSLFCKLTFCAWYAFYYV